MNMGLQHLPPNAGMRPAAPPGARLEAIVQARTKRFMTVPVAIPDSVRVGLGNPAGQVRSKLFVGPVVGEFGWELMGVSTVRAIAHRYLDITVSTRAGREALYRDFAQHVVAHGIDCIGESMGAYYKGGGRLTEATLGAFDPPGADILRTPEHHPRIMAKFIVYGRPCAKYTGAIVVHARTRGHVRMRNWSQRNWTWLLDHLRKMGLADQVVSIGGEGDAMAVPETTDLRGAGLQAQMDVLRSARLAIGPSSGPMHLAQHCLCPVVVWCGGGAAERHSTTRRYQSSWNPHGVAAMAVPYASWQPPPPMVLGWVQQMLARLDEGARK